MESLLKNEECCTVIDGILKYFEITKTTRKDGHLAYVVDGKCCFSFNFTIEKLLTLPPPDEVIISFKEAVMLVDKITNGIITEEIYSSLVNILSENANSPLVFIRSIGGEGLFIVSSDILIILVKEKNKSYEATIADAVIH